MASRSTARLLETPPHTLRPRMHVLPPATPAQEAAFLRALETHQSRTGLLVAAARNWRRNGFALFLVAAGSLAMNFYQATRSQVVPYIIEVDRVGAPRVVGPATEVSRATDVKDDWIQSHLASFVEDVRVVSTDTNMTRAALRRAWTKARGAALVKINDFVESTRPFDLPVKQRVSVEVMSVISATPDTWQVDWKETRVDATGSVVDSSLWRGLFRVRFEPTAKRKGGEVFMKNPLGIFVQEFDWKVLPKAP